MSRALSAIGWFGGKGVLWPKFMPYMTAWKHLRYVEPFGGGASVLLNKPPVEVEVYNDVDESVSNLFRVLSNPDDFEAFKRRVESLGVSRSIYNEYMKAWETTEDRIERAAMWFYVAKLSFSGQFGGGMSTRVKCTSRNMSATTALYLSTIEKLPEIHERMRRVLVDGSPWQKIIDRYDTRATLFYLDPPYVHDTRSSGSTKIYAHEMTNEDHEELVARVLTIEGQAVLSGYAHEIYSPLEAAGWARIDIETVCFAAKSSGEKKPKRTESLWLSPVVMSAYQKQRGRMRKRLNRKVKS